MDRAHFVDIINKTSADLLGVYLLSTRKYYLVMIDLTDITTYLQSR